MAYEADRSSLDGGFAVVRKGYDQGQVDTHLRRLDAEIQILATDRDAAIDQSAQLGQELDTARMRTERLRVQVRNLVSPPQSIQGMSERMRSMLRLAEDEASEMIKRAELESTQTQLDAEAQAAEVIANAQAQAAELQEATQARADSSAQEFAQARAEFEEEVRATRARFAADHAAAEQQRAALWAESETRRKLVEEDFNLAMNRRRTEALGALTSEQERLESNVGRMRDAATAHAKREMEQARAGARAELERAREAALAITAEGQRRVRELLLLRNRIVEQLGGTHSALGEFLAALEPMPAEQAPQTSTSVERSDVPMGEPDLEPLDASSAEPPPPAGRRAGSSPSIPDDARPTTSEPAAAVHDPVPIPDSSDQRGPAPAADAEPVRPAAPSEPARPTPRPASTKPKPDPARPTPRPGSSRPRPTRQAERSGPARSAEAAPTRETDDSTESSVAAAEPRSIAPVSPAAGPAADPVPGRPVRDPEGDRSLPRGRGHRPLPTLTAARNPAPDRR